MTTAFWCRCCKLAFQQLKVMLLSTVWLYFSLFTQTKLILTMKILWIVCLHLHSTTKSYCYCQKTGPLTRGHPYNAHKFSFICACQIQDKKCIIYDRAKGWKLSFSVFSVTVLHLFLNFFQLNVNFSWPGDVPDVGGEKLNEPIDHFQRFYPHVCECNHVTWHWLIFIMMDETLWENISASLVETQASVMLQFSKTSCRFFFSACW